MPIRHLRGDGEQRVEPTSLVSEKGLGWKYLCWSIHDTANSENPGTRWEHQKSKCTLI